MVINFGILGLVNVSVESAKQCLFQCTEIGRIKTRNIKVWSSKFSHGTYGNNLLLNLHEIHWSRELSVPWLIAEHKNRDQMSAHLLFWNARTWTELQEDLSLGARTAHKSISSKGGFRQCRFAVACPRQWTLEKQPHASMLQLGTTELTPVPATHHQLCREPAEASVLAWPTWPKAGQGNFFMLQTHYTQYYISMSLEELIDPIYCTLYGYSACSLYICMCIIIRHILCYKYSI